MVDKPRRRDVLGGIGTAGIASLAGCFGLFEDDSDGQTIQLGLLMGVSGALEQLGPPIRDAAQLVPTQINDADTDFEVETQFEDTQTNPSEGVTGAEALINAGYPMICGALSSEVTLQVAESAAIENQVTMCTPASTTPDLTTLEDNDLAFRTCPSDAEQGALLATIAAEDLGHDKAGVLALNNAYGSGLAQGFVETFENEYDGTAARENFASGESSYSSQLQSVIENDTDVLLLIGYPGDGVNIFRDFYSDFDRADMDILVSDGLEDEELPENVGEDMSNVRGTAPLGEGPGVDFFQSQYEEEYGDPPSGPFLRQAYDAAAALTLAHAAAGDDPSGADVSENMRTVTSGDGEQVTPESLADGVEMAANGDDIVYEGVAGSVEFDDNGDLGSVSYKYFEFTEAGDIETVETRNP